MKYFIIVALASTGLAATVKVQNNCEGPVQWQHDSTGVWGTPETLDMDESFSVDIAGTGSAIKFSPTGDFSKPISFDLSIDQQAYYDVSDIAGHPIDVFATPSEVSCSPVSCPEGEGSPCNATKACTPDANYTVYLCDVGPVSAKAESQLKAPRRMAAWIKQ